MRKRLLLVPALLAPAMLAAQREPLRQASSVPVELAAALAAAGNLGMQSDPQILVGEIPEWMAARLHLPAGAVILGTAFAGSSAVSVVQTLEADESLLRELESELAKKGWRKPENRNVPQGGFQYVAPPNRSSRSPTVFCSADKMLLVNQGTARQGKQNWFFRVNDLTAGFGTCNPPPVRGRSQSYPLLHHPADAARDMAPFSSFDCERVNLHELGGGGGTGDRIRTSWSPDSLLRHYGRQLADSGWKMSGAEGAKVSRTWTRARADGRTEAVRIEVQSSTDNPSCRSLSLAVFGPDR